MTSEEEAVRVLAAMRTRWLADRMVLAAAAKDVIENVSNSCNIYHSLDSARMSISETIDSVNNAIADYNQLIDLDTLKLNELILKIHSNPTNAQTQ